MSSRLILVRHSMPETNRDVPAAEWKLSEEGRVRANRLADALIEFRPEKLLSSPEPKAIETAEIVAAKLHLSVSVIDDFHEHKRSNVPFLSRSEFESTLRAFFEKPGHLIFGSETANEAYDRFSRAVFSALGEEKGNTTVIVSHGTVMSLFVSRLIGEAPFPLWSTLGLPGFIILDMQSNKLIANEKIF